MSRRTQAPTRVVLPDPKFGSQMLAKFMNMVMEAGKKSAAEKIMYGAIDRISEKTGREGEAALELLSTALENVKPADLVPPDKGKKTNIRELKSTIQKSMKDWGKFGTRNIWLIMI